MFCRWFIANIDQPTHEWVVSNVPKYIRDIVFELGISNVSITLGCVGWAVCTTLIISDAVDEWKGRYPLSFSSRSSLELVLLQSCPIRFSLLALEWVESYEKQHAARQTPICLQEVLHMGRLILTWNPKMQDCNWRDRSEVWLNVRFCLLGNFQKFQKPWFPCFGIWFRASLFVVFNCIVPYPDLRLICLRKCWRKSQLTWVGPSMHCKQSRWW